MYTLMSFCRGFNEPSVSPFCVKAMILLQMSGRPWRREDISNAASMPYGKVPVLRVGDSLIPESDRIEEWLARQGADYYSLQSPAQRALGVAVTRMVEESLRLALIHDRWLNEACWPHVWPVLFKQVPRWMRKPIAHKVRRSVRDGLMKSGYGRLPEQDRLFKANADLDALGGILGDNCFFMGATPTTVDAAVLPVLSAIDHLPIDTDLGRLLRLKPWVSRYLIRARKELYENMQN